MARSWKTVRELLARGRAVHAVGPDDTVIDALALMEAKDIGAVVVLDGERLIGILSERDCARRLVLRGGIAKDTAVRDIMTRAVIVVTPDHRIDQCMAVMRRGRMRHLPVVERGRVLTVLSIRDVLEEVIAEEEHLIHDLETERLVMTTSTGSY